jgi:hypothetical protein
MSLDEWLARRPATDAPIVEAVLAHLESLGPIVVDAVPVGVLVRGERTFVEIRPRRSGVRVSIVLMHDVASARIVRRERSNAGWIAVFVDLTSTDDVDDQLRAWLTESYAAFNA